ncbi:MAG TPA: hypothetical protein VNG90_03715 [Candidatus Acidoferrum sp.]|nr:hypothetical protein [Candidatus Acidoferrum sp.]
MNDETPTPTLLLQRIEALVRQRSRYFTITARKVIWGLGDGQWHAPSELAHDLQLPPKNVSLLLFYLAKDGFVATREQKLLGRMRTFYGLTARWAEKLDEVIAYLGSPVIYTAPWSEYAQASSLISSVLSGATCYAVLVAVAEAADWTTPDEVMSRLGITHYTATKYLHKLAEAQVIQARALQRRRKGNRAQFCLSPATKTEIIAALSSMKGLEAN